MLSLPNSPYLGVLRIDEIYEYFDFPRLFSATSKAGATFLAVSTFDDGEQFEWLYLPLSLDRLASVVAGKITLYQAFTQPEDGYLFKAVTDTKGAGTVDHLFPEQIPQEDLPAPDARLSPSSDGNMRRYGLGEIEATPAAQASRRETYNLHLSPPGMTSPELSSRALGNLLIDIQDLVDAIGQSRSGDVTIKGVIPAEILKQTRLDACQIFEGSFGLQLKGHQSPDLFDKSLLGESLEELMGLFKIGANEDLISNKLHALKGRVASKYRKLLRDLVLLGTSLKVDWGSPVLKSGGSAYVDKQTLYAAYEVVSKMSIAMEEEVYFIGKLLGMDVKVQRFRVLDLENSVEYTGTIDDPSILAEESNIHGHYRVTLLKVSEVNPSSGSERTKWLLRGLERLPRPA